MDWWVSSSERRQPWSVFCSLPAETSKNHSEFRKTEEKKRIRTNLVCMIAPAFSCDCEAVG